ncbi:MAG: SulP family inorganic anion transporter, partial [Myxococcota bacterium]
LLCATAVDQMQTGPRTNYNKELWAQGVGNIICGLLGALPMTGVIVRSSANVDAGAKTRWSAIIHGAWLLLLVGLTPFVLELIPTAALAAILVYTGYKLAHPSNIRKLARFGRGQVAVYVVTLSVIVATDLLKGVLVGLALAVALMVYHTNKVKIHVDPTDDPGQIIVRLAGVASFLTLPMLAEALEKLPDGKQINLDYEDIVYIDQAVVEMIEGWRRRYMASGGVVNGLSEPELVERAHTQMSIAAK